MKFLWFTLADPDPATNGQYLYSRGLIEGVAAAGVAVVAVGLARPEGLHRDGERTGNVVWRLAPHRPRSRWSGIVSRWPIVVSRTRTRELRAIVEALLADDSWDAIVIDSINLAWVIEPVLQRYKDNARPTLIYLSHNHETSVAARLARAEPRWLMRAPKHLDRLKMRWLESALLRHCALVTANTPDDRERFAADAREKKPVLFVPPGYGGVPLENRRIDASVPRRAILVGSFDWGAKRASLEAFLAAADPLFARAGIELCVVGAAEETFLARLRQSVRATHFTGRVEDVVPYMREARLALVPDELGGFKLKSLDYIFNRLPILGLDGSVPGLPLRPGEGILVYPDHETLARAVVELIDDFDRLNAIQETAFIACRDSFNWRRIGRDFVAATRQVSYAESAEAAASVRDGLGSGELGNARL
jgi:polysaccharide biosynthesis protein PslH